MESICGDPFLDQLGTKYPFLTQLPLCNIHKSFESHSGKVKQYSLCDSLIDKKKDKFSEINIICKTADVLFKSLKPTSSGSDLNDVHKNCEYLKYWLYDRTKHINRPCDNVENLYATLNLFIKSLSLSKECPNISDFVVGQNKFNTKKELYFHTENLYWIKNKFSTVHVEDKYTYNKYLGECCRFYSKIVNDKYCNNESWCTLELIKFREHFNETRTFLSDNEIPISVDKINVIDNPICPSENGDVRAPIESPGYAAVMGDLPSDEDFDTESDDNSSTKIGTVILFPVIATIMGILLILLFLYKFTPFEPWLYRTIRGKSKILDNLNEKIIGLFHNSRHHRNSLSNDFNIQYHSSLNL
ncbi:PIR Superfamily Protein [Plasmodium ovale curtisi]|uniref:PIR Superfamily Protein n=1 Tax=Plasmodium ovale curtisi TaxID=864141 RepID=A0A1A8WJH8_PLAOA|nr:PIR Superfamily Protein [Plasmodium ovale curtisi]SBT02459.1 PIR Superfamily Protein [Plasmodium ovale curtisi]